MSFNCKVFLVNVVSEQDSSTGKTRLKEISRTMVYADEQEVGLSEYYSAQSQKKELVAVYEVPAHLYHNESYLFVGDKQYKITRSAKGRTPAFVRLPCIQCQKKDIIERDL